MRVLLSGELESAFRKKEYINWYKNNSLTDRLWKHQVSFSTIMNVIKHVFYGDTSHEYLHGQRPRTPQLGKVRACTFTIATVAMLTVFTVAHMHSQLSLTRPALFCLWRRHRLHYGRATAVWWSAYRLWLVTYDVRFQHRLQLSAFSNHPKFQGYINRNSSGRPVIEYACANCCTHGGRGSSSQSSSWNTRFSIYLAIQYKCA